MYIFKTGVHCIYWDKRPECLFYLIVFADGRLLPIFVFFSLGVTF